MASLPEFRHLVAQRLTQHIVTPLSRTGITPNMLTALGFLVSILAAIVIAQGNFLLGGFLVLFSGTFDLLDGALARAKGQTTVFGALLDSTLDRLSEAAVLFGLLFFYVGKDSPVESLLVFVALTGSFLISYVRARAEGLGLRCEVGLFTRAERVVALALGLLLNQVFVALWIVAVVTMVTVVQRLLFLRREIAKKL